MTTVTISELRAALPKYIQMAADGKSIRVTIYGRVVAVIQPAHTAKLAAPLPDADAQTRSIAERFVRQRPEVPAGTTPVGVHAVPVGDVPPDLSTILPGRPVR